MKNKKREIEKERHEKLVRAAKSRGGRPTQVIKDKKKYDRKRDKPIKDDE